MPSPLQKGEGKVGLTCHDSVEDWMKTRRERVRVVLLCCAMKCCGGADVGGGKKNFLAPKA